jgi:hypothetical protein
VTDFSKINLSAGLKYTLKSMPRGKNYKGKISNTCTVPTNTVTIDADSNCFLCGCDGWLPIPVGKVNEFDTLEDVLNSPIAKMLQEDVREKKFSWCAVENCGIIYNDNTHVTDYSLNINIDNSCNLACPSCRRDMVMISSGPEYEKKVEDVNHILRWLEKFNDPIEISIGGSGDALASVITRNLIKNYSYKPTQRFNISTNGLLLKKVIADSAIQPAIVSYCVSVDAGSAEVYEQVRRPGKWSVLLENLEWLAENKGKANVMLSFVAQKTNYKDLSNFAELCKKFNFNGDITMLNDWGTWNSKPVLNPDAWTIANGTYMDHNVADPAHPEHTQFIEALKAVHAKKYKCMHNGAIFNKFI